MREHVYQPSGVAAKPCSKCNGQPKEHPSAMLVEKMLSLGFETIHGGVQWIIIQEARNLGWDGYFDPIASLSVKDARVAASVDEAADFLIEKGVSFYGRSRTNHAWKAGRYKMNPVREDA